MIRRGTVEDVRAVAELYERSFATLRFLPVLHTVDEHEAWFTGKLEHDELWVYDEDGAVVGFTVLSENELVYLYLDVPAIGRGIGTKLLEHAKARRPRGFTLWTFQANERARRFYEKHGLEAVQFTDGAGNEEKMPDVKYAWRPPSTKAGG